MLATLLYNPLQGFTVDNKSLSGRPKPIFPTRLRFLTSPKKEIYIRYSFLGAELSWGTMEQLGIYWGDNNTLRYPYCLPGWKYEWDLDTHTFTVTDAASSATVYSDVSTLSELGIAWGILESRQFVVYKTMSSGDIEIVTGANLNWVTMDSMGITWGDNTVLRYATRQTGWNYTWDLDTHIFTVTDAAGQSTSYAAITTLSDLGISWDILESTQFYISRTKPKTNEVFLPAVRIDPQRPTQTMSYARMAVDYLLTGEQHVVFDYLIDYIANELTEHCSVNTNFKGEEAAFYNLLLARTDELNATSCFPLDLISTEKHYTADRQIVQHIGHMQPYSYLMIMLFASGCCLAMQRSFMSRGCYGNYLNGYLCGRQPANGLESLICRRGGGDYTWLMMEK